MYTTRITRTLEENPGARKVRTAVFMEEQGYKNEFDDHDADAVHLCIYDGEEGIATARSYQKPDASGYWAGWLCSGSAGAIGWAAGRSRSWRSISAAGCQRDRTLRPAACMKMYEALGYKEEGDLIYDEGQPHKMMRKFL